MFNINSIEIKIYNQFKLDEILHLYQSVGWSNYIDQKEHLKSAYENSLCTFAAYDQNNLVGIIRAVGDGLTIVFVQDILVLPTYQCQGIGTKLLQTMIEKYKHVYMMELVTYNTEKTIAFYESIGFSSAEKLDCTTFIKM